MNVYRSKPIGIPRLKIVTTTSDQSLLVPGQSYAFPLPTVTLSENSAIPILLLSHVEGFPKEILSTRRDGHGMESLWVKRC
jgi:hypothetical protein